MTQDTQALATVVKYETAHGEITLSIPEIRRYLCPTATDQEAYLFLRLCQAQHLNPFTREAYLIKYSATQAATMVVGKEAFTQRAEAHPQFDGFTAGVIVLRGGEEMVYLTSSFAPPQTTLFGGWAEVYRKDRSHPVRAEVPLDEYQTGQSSWKRMAGTMIRKVALVQALREAFPQSFAGLYDAAEMRVDTDTGVIDTPPPAQQPPPQPRTATPPAPAVSAATQTPARVPAATLDAAKAEREQEKAQAHAQAAAQRYPQGWRPSDADDLLQWAIDNGITGKMLRDILKTDLETAVKKSGLIAVFGDLLAAKPN